MKRIIALMGLVAILLAGCGSQTSQPEGSHVAATTLPVFEFTSRLCEGTDITVSRLVTENVSCLHDYALNVGQVKTAEAAELIVISGAGLEDFMADVLEDKPTVDASAGITLLESGDGHEHDAHIWLSPENAGVMARNICAGLVEKYPVHQQKLEANLAKLLADIEEVKAYGDAQLSDLSCTGIVTFHDGFSYFADAYGLTILKAVEEEAGAEASAAEIQAIVGMVREYGLTAIFVEVNGSTSAADTISAETGAQIYALDMAMAGDSWFDAMYRNIDTIKEALG